MRQIASISDNHSSARTSETLAWLLIAAIGTAAALAMAATGLAFDWPSALRPALCWLILVCGALFYRTRRPDEAVAASLVAVAQMIAFGAVSVTLSYAVTARGGPLWDATFAAWDRRLGLDWHAYFAAVAGRPWLSRVFNLAYASLMVQIILAAGLLGLAGGLAACRGFVFATILAGLATIVISGLMPANTALVHFGLRPQDVPFLDISGATGPAAPFAGLRAGTLRLVSLSNAEGLITFPSFHAALGVIFLRAFWSVRWLRWPAAALNLTMIAATPVNGGHYFIDVAAGVVVAVLAIRLADRLQHAPVERRAVAEPAGAAT